MRANLRLQRRIDEVLDPPQRKNSTPSSGRAKSRLEKETRDSHRDEGLASYSSSVNLQMRTDHGLLLPNPVREGLPTTGEATRYT
jgi:hypothetical protein